MQGNTAMRRGLASSEAPRSSSAKPPLSMSAGDVQRRDIGTGAAHPGGGGISGAMPTLASVGASPSPIPGQRLREARISDPAGSRSKAVTVSSSEISLSAVRASSLESPDAPTELDAIVVSMFPL